MSFLARLVSDNSRSKEKFEFGSTVLPATPKEKFLHEVRVLVHCYLHVRFDLHSPVNFKGINGSQNWGPRTIIRGHPRGSKSGTVVFYRYDFLLVINCSPRPYLAPFPRYSLQHVQHHYIWLPLLRLTSDGVLLGRSL